MKKTVSRYDPASSGKPRATAISPAGAVRFGPMTAPIVVPHTTSRGPTHAFRGRHVGGDVAAEVPGRVREAGEGAAEEQQRDRAGQDRAERDGAAEDANREPEQEAMRRPGAA